MEALGPGDDRTSPASSTRSLDLRRLSARADSAYSSFSAASGGPEPHTLSPGTGVLAYLDWENVRVVWGGPAPAAPTAVLHTSLQPRPAAAVRSGPRPPEVWGTPGPPNRQTTPLLYPLTAEAKTAARATEPRRPPASRAAYRQRLQGAQRRVLRETSFQRKELRMSPPARRRPSAPARPPAEHPRSASLSHPGGEVESARSGASAPQTGGRGDLAKQQRKWCFSEPGRLDRVGRGGGGLVGEGGGKACSSSCLPRPQEHQEPQEHGVLAEFEGLSEPQTLGIEDPNPGSLKLSVAYRPRCQSRSPSGEVLAPWGGPGEGMPIIQAVPQGAETPRPLFKTRLCNTKSFLPGHCGQDGVPASRVLNQKEAAVACPAEGLQSSPARVQRVSES
ncbi:Protein Shroom1 [Manis pentadactyla]|nr:Protein Shroom1 [Manis pentadactyla]